MPCPDPAHTHVWPSRESVQSGSATLTIKSCERICAYCIGDVQPNWSRSSNEDFLFHVKSWHFIKDRGNGDYSYKRVIREERSEGAVVPKKQAPVSVARQPVRESTEELVPGFSNAQDRNQPQRGMGPVKRRNDTAVKVEKNSVEVQEHAGSSIGAKRKRSNSDVDEHTSVGILERMEKRIMLAIDEKMKAVEEKTKTADEKMKTANERIMALQRSSIASNEMHTSHYREEAERNKSIRGLKQSSIDKGVAIALLTTRMNETDQRLNEMFRAFDEEQAQLREKKDEIKRGLAAINRLVE